MSWTYSIQTAGVSEYKNPEDVLCMCTHPVDPPTVHMCLRSTANEGTKSNANDTRHAKNRHRKTAILIALPNI
jgi:hypothetical protein